MKTRFSILFLGLVLLIAIPSCSDDTDENPPVDVVIAPVTPRAESTSSVFTEDVVFDLPAGNWNQLSSITFEVAPKNGALAKPMKATYSKSALQEKGYYSGGQLTLPVFGLYENHSNTVSLSQSYVNGEVQNHDLEITTGNYQIDGHHVDDILVITNNYTPTTELGFSYILLKTRKGPHVLDVDGELRWSALDLEPGLGGNASAMMYYGNKFIWGNSTIMQMIELDGNVRDVVYQTGSFNQTNLHHDITAGRDGILLEVTTGQGANRHFQNTVFEVNENGEILKEWDFGQIIVDHINANSPIGQNPHFLVQDGGTDHDGDGNTDGPVDWCHMNSAIYDANTNTIIISSREQFVMAVGYDDKEIKWILGDETKHWYVNFPSLQALSLSLAAEGKAPIGQHSLTIDSDGNLFLFNNGDNSDNQPAGEPAGEQRTESYLSRYSINGPGLSAEEIQSVDLDQYSARVSSVAETSGYILANFGLANDGHTYNYILDRNTEEILFMTRMQQDATDGNWSENWHSDIIDLTDIRYE